MSVLNLNQDFDLEFESIDEAIEAVVTEVDAGAMLAMLTALEAEPDHVVEEVMDDDAVGLEDPWTHRELLANSSRWPSSDSRHTMTRTDPTLHDSRNERSLPPKTICNQLQHLAP
ncbi:hypothetical protein [Aeoliella mucimassa]|uniref:Uncharacterized protein n=1 Tax=Aeoliella mucimassa TaxID=2527972 RepID=A0A518AJN1_9BACT|nr:hypothetical protein [Aeoliella mucimassa]QDU54943.1 hypothetical protein Pan181_11280 [Aeoliella mucimassa]